jgi:peptide/nickel transport system substrate-binding protein
MLSGFEAELDPAKEYHPRALELFRCCLLRTLLSYNGHEASEGGADLQPDLASSMPEVSADGLRWTFRLKDGLHYGPPLQDTPIVAGDIARAIERVARRRVHAAYPFYYSIIRGFDQYARGDADSIYGLQAVSDSTLIVYLTRPAGDLGYRLALPAAAPIAPNPTRPSDPLGVAEGHDFNYGRFLVASGPYMVSGSEDLDFRAPADEQQPSTGYVRGTSLTLVRNPSWSSATDPLRPAYVRRISITIGGTSVQIARQVAANESDLLFGSSSAPTFQVRRYMRSPVLRTRVYRHSGNSLAFLPLNVALPPFDDVHVRRAVNLALDKAAFVQLARLPGGGATDEKVATHALPDGVEGNLLSEFDPYYTPDHRGSVVLAREELARSHYDRDGDGTCDVPVCRRVRVAARRSEAGRSAVDVVRASLAPLGIRVKAKFLTYAVWTKRLLRPYRKVSLLVWTVWAAPFPNGSTFYIPLLFGRSLTHGSTPKLSLVGAKRRDLKRWGYPVPSVPSIDADIEDCMDLVGDAQTECWALLDKLVSLKVVPWVPIGQRTTTQVVSARVSHFTFDEFSGLPALDEISVLNGS